MGLRSGLDYIALVNWPVVLFFDVTNRLEIVYVMFFLEVDHIFYCKHYIKKMQLYKDFIFS